MTTHRQKKKETDKHRGTLFQTNMHKEKQSEWRGGTGGAIYKKNVNKKTPNTIFFRQGSYFLCQNMTNDFLT